MSKIKILSENLANQIAAGEVVERPASVVKEFVENAIDAGAKNISIQIEGGGTGLIRVIDDGEGMDEDDILLSLERHATSKITSAEQLTAIDTLGFRGEAVPSIASVARLTITSRLAAQPLGCRVDIRFGKLMQVHEMGCGFGTVMEVRDLFGNVPARRKFLKTIQTELSHIEEVVRNYALGYPRLGINYTVKDRDVFRLQAGVDDRLKRVSRILGPDLAAQFIRVKEAGNNEDIVIDGYLLAPEIAQGGNTRLRIFVNGRAVRDRMITQAVAEGMQGFLMKGKRPGGVIYVEIDPAVVDVNVHPTKQEIRFNNAKVVQRTVSGAVIRALREFQDDLKVSIFYPDDKPVSEPVSRVVSSPLVYPAIVAESRLAEPEIPFRVEKKIDYPAKPPTDCAKMVKSTAGTKSLADVRQGDEISVVSPESLPDLSSCDQLFGQSATEPVFRIIGQLLGTYILSETSEGLVVIDQHAAQERLIFEKLKGQYAARSVVRQALLFPKMLELGPEELETIETYGQEITALGLDLQEFGGASFVVKAVPAILGHLAPETMVGEILAQFTSRPSRDRIDGILASMACKAAIKAGDDLSELEMEALLKQILAADVFSHCPHGRPVVKRFAPLEIKKWFRRT